jgi:peptidoglycan/LPS O-acetylase OafA/YrhL
MADRPKIRGLQQLRAAGAFMVILAHICDTLAELHGVHVGFIRLLLASAVDFFFVLSGFIAYYVAGSRIGQPREAMRFLSRRITRIYPIYWFYLACVVGLVLATRGFEHTRHDLALANIGRAALLTFDHHTLIATSWTLSFEIYFYVMFGLLLASRYGFVVWGAVTLGALAANFGVTHPSGALLFLVHPLWLEFLLGALVGYASGRGRRRGVTLVALLALFVGLSIAFGDAAFVRVWKQAPLMALIIWAVARQPHWRFSSPMFVDRFGNAALTAALAHWPLLRIYNRLLMPFHFGPVTLGALNILFAIAFVPVAIRLFERVEKPVQERMNQLLKWKARGRPLTKAAAVLPAAAIRST